MSNPELPRYLGSLKELIEKLLHDPFLGSGGGPHPPRTHLEAAGPSPDPWSPTANLIVMAAAFKDIASRMPESQVATAVNTAVADWEDGICPPPHPRPHVLVAAVEVLALASTLEEGSLRTSLAREAGTILEKSFAAGGERSAALTAVA